MCILLSSAVACSTKNKMVNVWLGQGGGYGMGEHIHADRPQH